MTAPTATLCAKYAGRPTVLAATSRVRRAGPRIRTVEKSLETYKERPIEYDNQREYRDRPIRDAMTFAEAGAALRRWRERNELCLEDIASRTGLDVTQLSYIERGMRRPQRKTIEKLESGMGWTPGLFNDLSALPDDPGALDRMLDGIHEGTQSARTISVRVSEAGVLEGYAEASIGNLDSLIRQLPAPGTPRFAQTVAAALGQCGKAEVLAANSWRVSAVTDRDTAHRLLEMLGDLESKRVALLDRVPESVGARFDHACQLSGLPEALIAVLTGLTPDELWQIRCGGSVPEGSNARVAAFIKAVNLDGP